jgi:hypothetical protein
LSNFRLEGGAVFLAQLFAGRYPKSDGKIDEYARGSQQTFSYAEGYREIEDQYP